MPKTASAGGLTIDVNRDLHSTQSIDGDQDKEKAYHITSGMIGSYLEGSIFEQMFGRQAISTMHILNYANQQGVAVYTINQDNVDTVLPQLEYSDDKK
ncbi:hypothetical protein [Orenia marismortui]|uniref:Uncharacterized protein n=1 Tax=Orenia marismortui TaxID=46469 RepID=A0A4R8H2R1_9FIRM|nr:hypothetical protein [Orenia marismortui]TDX48923.1 hypothetical protein C7959_12434 [Orenia marismortui]